MGHVRTWGTVDIMGTMAIGWTDDDGQVSKAENELINCHLSRTRNKCICTYHRATGVSSARRQLVTKCLLNNALEFKVQTKLHKLNKLIKY